MHAGDEMSRNRSINRMHHSYFYATNCGANCLGASCLSPNDVKMTDVCSTDFTRASVRGEGGEAGRGARIPRSAPPNLNYPPMSGVRNDKIHHLQPLTSD